MCCVVLQAVAADGEACVMMYCRQPFGVAADGEANLAVWGRNLNELYVDMEDAFLEMDTNQNGMISFQVAA
jgi:hypothetical protein